MDFLEVEAGVSQQSDVLVPSSQQGFESSEPPRASKRRRLNVSSQSSDGEYTSHSDEYDLPSNEIEEDDEFDQPKSKYANYMHVPAQVESQEDQFLTQLDNPWSSPSAIRGPQWRKKNPSPAPEPLNTIGPVRPLGITKPTIINSVKSGSVVADEFDDDDDELLEAIMVQHEHGKSEVGLNARENTRSAQTTSMPPPQPPAKSFRQTTLFGMQTTQKTPPRATQARTNNWPMVNRNEPPTHHKIDREAMKSWIYPLNVGTIRDYQFNIVHKALFHNILVALPTGLGKTFIAATVMLNYFRWTSDAQIVFVAPTKPLVTQQVEACFHIAGIPRSNTTLLTGEIAPGIRAEQWQEKRVFFMTPQTLINDLKTGMADPKKIVLLVVDEAHKATGNYAYVEVVRFLRRFNSSFRVLALTATPGATVEAVQKVIDGLDIARVEIRTEESLDIRSFVHSRNTEIQLFDNSEEIDMCLDLFANSVRPVLNKVNSLNAYFSNDPKTLTLYGLLKGREQWTKSDAGRKADWGLKGMVNACFKPLMSLAHNLELLKFHGIGPFYHKMRIFDEESSGGGKYTKQIVESDNFRKLMNLLRTWVNKDDFVGHPKLSYLNEVVLNHFMDAGDGAGTAGGRPPSDTRIMVFAHYRDSAEEIVRVLNRHEPMIRAHVFVGQSGTKGSEGMDQKTQIDIIKKFKAGTYNTLVATSIGEEGLDIGEVDLIVCYDCSKSPIRMLQRMGRTGRKRAGNIVLLLMRGKEERDYQSAKDNYLKMQEIIEDGSHFQFHEDMSPRIVPREVQPAVDKRMVEIPIENTQPGSAEPSKRKGRAPKKPPKKFHMPDGVETGFAFLGAGGKKKGVQRAPSPQPLVDKDFASLPPLTDVILSAREEDELERRFAQVAGSETVYVRSIRFDAHPERVQRFSKVAIIQHSAATKALVKASEGMRNVSRTWERPREMVVCSPVSESEEERRRASHGGRKGSERQKIDRPPVNRTTSTKTQRTRQKQYSVSSDHDEALDRSPVLSNQAARAPPLSVDLTKRKGTVSRRRLVSHTDSQPSHRSIESDEEDLPELSTMFDANQNKSARTDVTMTVARQGLANGSRRRARRVLSDESDG